MIKLILISAFITPCCAVYKYYDTFGERIEAGQDQVQRFHKVSEFVCCSKNQCKGEDDA